MHQEAERLAGGQIPKGKIKTLRHKSIIQRDRDELEEFSQSLHSLGLDEEQSEVNNISC